MSTDDHPTTAARVITLVVVCLALFMALLDSTVISLILPAIRTDLGADLTGLIWIADGYVLVFAALLLTAGSLGDRLGRARLFLAGVVVFTAGSVLCAAAPNLATLVGGRVLQGIGAAMVTPQTMAIITHTFPAGPQRARAFGIWSGVSGLALVLGPVVGGTLTDLWGWRAVFFINLPVGLVTLLLGARALRVTAGRADRPDAPLRRAVDLPGQLLTIAWLGTLTFALIEGARWGWGSPVIVVLLACAALGFAALLVVERRVAHPMLRLDLFRSATFSASTLVIALIAFGMYASFFLISMFLQQVQGYSAAGAGVRFLPAMSVIVVTAPLAGALAGRIGSRVPVVAGTALMGVSLLMISRVAADASYSSWVIWLVTFGVGIGLTIPPVNSALMSSVPPDRSGLAAATGQTGQQVGALVGIAVLGAVVTSGFQQVVARGAAAAGLSTTDIAELARNLFSETAPASERPEVTDLVARALTEGVHWGLVAAGLAALAAAVVALAIRGGQPDTEVRPPQQPAAQPPAPADAESPATSSAH